MVRLQEFFLKIVVVSAALPMWVYRFTVRVVGSFKGQEGSRVSREFKEG